MLLEIDHQKLAHTHANMYIYAYADQFSRMDIVVRLISQTGH